MKTIWKYKIPVTDTFAIDIPGRRAQFLSLQAQGDERCMWWLVDPESPPERRRFVVYGTGHDMPDAPGAYVGTFQVHGGALVFHVFEVTS